MPSHEELSPGFPLIAIGASAGALDDIELLVRSLPPAAALLIVQHAPAEAVEPFRRLLQQATKRAVEVARDGALLAPGKVFVVPGFANVELEGNVLRVSPGQGDGPAFPIDRLFRAAAGAFGARACGVLLSGTGSDGVLGMRAIRERGGLTIAQNPRTARHASMPERALAAGYADLCLSPAQMAAELERAVGRGAAPGPLVDAAVEAELAHLLEPRGLDVRYYRPELVEGRMSRRMALRQIDSLSEYLELLERSDDEVGALARDLLINVTGFFRDAPAFDALTGSVLPSLLKNRPSKSPLRMWVPGCSTGEEAYSLVIALLEQAPDVAVQVFATDVDRDALACARRGVYPAASTSGLSPERRLRFLVRQEQGYKVCNRVRESVVFARHDVARDPPYSQMDLVSCRNLLIYLRSEVQHRVLQSLHYALKPQGFLLVGSAESADTPQLFRVANSAAKLYVKRDTPPGTVCDFAAAADTLSGEAVERSSQHAVPVRSGGGADPHVQASSMPAPLQAQPSTPADMELRTLQRELRGARQELACALTENAVLNQELRATRALGKADAVASMVRALSVPLLVVDADLQIMHYSRGALEHFGRELVSRRVRLTALASCLGLVDLPALAVDALRRAACNHAQLQGLRGTYEVSLTPEDSTPPERLLYIELVPREESPSMATSAAQELAQ